MKGIRKFCEKYADNYPSVQTPTVLMTGESGLGKTFLMHAMAHRLLEHNKNVLLISSYRFLEISRHAYFDNAPSDLAALNEADVVFLDDLGSQPLMDNITVAQFFNLVNERQSSKKGLVISTNMTEVDMQKRYTERVTSRLFDGSCSTIMQFAGYDLRRAR